MQKIWFVCKTLTILILYLSGPNDIYRNPMTDANKSGWAIPKNQVRVETAYPWARTSRYVLCNSEMTR